MNHGIGCLTIPHVEGGAARLASPPCRGARASPCAIVVLGPSLRFCAALAIGAGLRRGVSTLAVGTIDIANFRAAGGLAVGAGDGLIRGNRAVAVARLHLLVSAPVLAFFGYRLRCLRSGRSRKQTPSRERGHEEVFESHRYLSLS